MKNFDWLQAFAMEQQEQPEPGVSADAAPQDEQERAEAFRALIQGPYKKDYDRQVQMIVRERLKNCARSEQVLKSLGPALEKTFGVDAAQLTPEQAEEIRTKDFFDMIRVRTGRESSGNAGAARGGDAAGV